MRTAPRTDVCFVEEALGFYEGRRCMKCGKPYPRTMFSNGPKVVCDECRKPRKEKPVRTAVCEGCGKTFEIEANHLRRKYCTPKCKAAAQRIKRTCKVCGVEFIATNAAARYCPEHARRKK